MGHQEKSWFEVECWRMQPESHSASAGVFVVKSTCEQNAIAATTDYLKEKPGGFSLDGEWRPTNVAEALGIALDGDKRAHTLDEGAQRFYDNVPEPDHVRFMRYKILQDMD